MSKPKILVFTTAYLPLVGGAEIAIKEITGRLKHQFDFLIFTAKLKKDLAVKEKMDEGQVFRLGLGLGIDKFLFPFFGFLKARKYLKRGGVLWGMDISTGSLAAALLKFFYPKSYFILTVQYGYGKDRLRKGRGGLIAHALKFILSQADTVTVISNYLGQVVKEYGYRGPLEVIPNGVDIDKFKAKSEKLKIGENKIIITTSRLVRKNGVDTLIEAVAEVKEKYPDIQCWIVGDGPKMNSYKLLVESYKLQNNVKFFGEVAHDDVPKYLAQADIFVRASRTEGMGNSFVEAMAAGLPAIGTSVGGILDIIKDNETGLLVEPEKPKALAEKIKVLLDDGDLAEKLADNGKKFVEKLFSWKGIAESFEVTFKKTVHKKNMLGVLIVTGLFPPDIGGPATYSKTLLDDMPKYGLDIRILSFGEIRKYPKLIRHFLFFLKCLWLGRKADIIFAQDPVSAGLPAWLAAKILRKKFLIKIVGDYAWEQGQQRFGIKDPLDDFLDKKYGWKVEILRKIEKGVATGARALIVPSSYLKGVVTKWGIKDDKINVVYNSFEPDGEVISRDTARKKLDLSGTVLVSVGRLVPWKGFELLIDLVADLGKEIKDLRLFIIGSGPEHRRLDLKIKKLGLENRVILTGKLAKGEVIKYLAASDIFVLNTGYEGLAHTILEAMGCGLPVITTKVGGNVEVIDSGTNGILIEYNDYSGFKNAVQKLINNDEVRKSLSRQATDKLKFFNKEKMLMETIKIMKDL